MTECVLPPSPTFVPKVGLGEPRSFGAGVLSFEFKIHDF